MCGRRTASEGRASINTGTIGTDKFSVVHTVCNYPLLVFCGNTVKQAVSVSAQHNQEMTSYRNSRGEPFLNNIDITQTPESLAIEILSKDKKKNVDENDNQKLILV